MKEYQKRVVNERNELDGRLRRLGDFIDTERFKSIDPEEQKRLERQYRFMCDYLDILNERIENF